MGGEMKMVEYVRLGDCIKQVRGVSYKPQDVGDKSNVDCVPIFRANNIQDDGLNYDDLIYVNRNKVSDEQFIRKNDILICASSGSKNLVGKAAIATVDEDIAFGAFCKVARPLGRINPSYLGYYFKSPAYRRTIANLAAGANINNIKNEHISNLPIPVPAEETQQHVVKILDTISGIIQKRKKQIVLLDDLAKSLFVEMFGDVIQNNKKWSMYLFSDIADSRLGKMLDAKQQTGKCSFPYLANFNVQWFSFNLEQLNRMDFNEADRIEFSLMEGDLLVCEGGEIGRCAVWNNELQNCYFQKALHRVRCHKEIVNPFYLAYWFKYNCEHNGFSTIAGAKATIAHLPGVKLKQLKVTIPPLSLQQEFAARIEKIETQRKLLNAGLKRMEKASQALMQEYFG